MREKSRHNNRAFDGIRSNSRSFLVHKKRFSDFWKFKTFYLFSFILLFIGGFSYFLYPRVLYILRSDNEFGALLAEVEYLRERKEGMQNDINSLGTDRGVESVLREDFLMTKPGEEVYVILEDEIQKDQGDKEKLGFWKRIINFFGF